MAKTYNKRIEICLNEREYKFIEWLAKRDDDSFQGELKTLFYLQLREEMDLYEDEMEMEEKASC